MAQAHKSSAKKKMTSIAEKQKPRRIRPWTAATVEKRSRQTKSKVSLQFTVTKSRLSCMKITHAAACTWNKSALAFLVLRLTSGHELPNITSLKGCYWSLTCSECSLSITANICTASHLAGYKFFVFPRTNSG
jgi:hypothetical protein